jgi:diacylglycerol kinase (ATP)
MDEGILCVVNRFAGSGEAYAMFSRFVKECKAKGLYMITARTNDYFKQYLRKFPLSKVSVIVVFGGDGTMHEVVNNLYSHGRLDIPVMLFPCGTGNAFNHDLGVFTYEKALEAFYARQVREVDLMLVSGPVNQRIAFNMMGWGLVAQINVVAEKMRWLGKSRYTLASLWCILKNPSEFMKIKVDQQKILEKKASFALLMNTKHTGKGMKMAPLAELQDGLMDLLFVRSSNLFKLLFLFPKIYSGKHVASDLLQYEQVGSCEVLGKYPQQLILDGEQYNLPIFHIEVLKRSLKIVA